MSLLMLTFGSMAFVSCGGDDDEDINGGGSGNIKSYVKADGKQTDFYYGYYVDDDEYIEVMVSNIDILYYYNHQDKVSENQLYSELFLEFEKDAATGNNVVNYDIEINLNLLLKALLEFDDDDDDSGYNPGSDQYIGYWGDSDPIKLTYSNGEIDAEGKSIAVVVSDDYYGDDSWNTTLDFCIKGNLKNAVNSRSTEEINFIEITDKNIKAFFRKLHRR